MSNEELCMMAKNGDQAAFVKLIEQNSGIICRIARYYMPAAVRNRGADMDDLTQAAALGMIEAVSAWDAARGAFMTIAVLYMRREVRALLGLHTQKERIENAKSIVLLSSPSACDEDIELIETIADFNAADPQEAACTADMQAIVRDAVQALPQEQREAVTAFYLQGKPMSSIDRRHRRKGLKELSRTSRILALMEEYHAHAERYGGISHFRYTHTSSVEKAVIERERIQEKMWGLFEIEDGEKRDEKQSKQKSIL